MKISLDSSVARWVQQSMGLTDEELAKVQISMSDQPDSFEIEVTFPDEGLHMEERHREAIVQLLRVSSDSLATGGDRHA